LADRGQIGRARPQSSVTMEDLQIWERLRDVDTRCVEGRGSGADFGGRGQIGRHVSGESGSSRCVAGWLARAGYPTAGITARRGRGGRGCLARVGYPAARATRAGRASEAEGRRAWGVDRGRGHGVVVDALRPPLRISRDSSG
jgi:hypothetical protein